MDRPKMIEDLQQELYTKETGHKTALTIFPGGKQDGLDYGPCLVEIVVLDTDGDTLAYRYSDDSVDNDWQLGTIEDAVDLLIQVHEEVKRQEELSKIEWQAYQQSLEEDHA